MEILRKCPLETNAYYDVWGNRVLCFSHSEYLQKLKTYIKKLAFNR